jgi:hypothetical protein
MTTAEPMPLALSGAAPTATTSGRALRFVSVVLPCLNEEEAVGLTVAEAQRGLRAAGVDGEVIVVDNGSTDRSVECARAAGAVIVHEETRGYGAAHLAGIATARGDVIVMADADQTYDLENLGRLLKPLREGADMVVASRLDTVAPGAMPVLHRYVGTPVITRVLRLLTGAPLSDSQSGYRAFWRDQMMELDLRAPGMEYASEMLLKAVRAELDVREVPAPYRVRVGDSKLNTFNDGWRHLRMLLILSPHLTLLLPGLLTIGLGLALSAISAVEPTGVEIGALRWLPIFAGPMCIVVGGQAVMLGAVAAERSEFAPPALKRRLTFLRQQGAVDRLLRRFAALAALGLLADAVLFTLWIQDRSGAELLGLAGLAQAAIILGVSGVVAVLSAEFAAESLWGPRTLPAVEDRGGAAARKAA